MTIDDQGRIALPQSLRDELGLNAGDTVIVDVLPDGTVELLTEAHMMRAIALDALRQQREGLTVPLEGWIAANKDLVGG